MPTHTPAARRAAGTKPANKKKKLRDLMKDKKKK